MKVKKITKPELEGDTYLIAQAVNNNAEVLENALNRIKALEREPFKNAYIQAAKERDIAIEQLNELGYSWGEKIRPCEKTVSVQDCINAIENTDCELSPQAWEEITSNIMSLSSVAPKQEPIIDRDCEHCSKIYGTLGCCSTVSNQWVYSCEKGHREYLLDQIRAEIEAQEKWLRQAGYNAYNVSVVFGAIKHILGILLK